MNKLAVILVLGVGLGAVAGVYMFRASRLTTEDIAEIAKASERVAAVDKEYTVDSGSEDEPAGIDLPSERTVETSGKVANSDVPPPPAPEPEPEPKEDLPPAVTVIPNESMPQKTPDTFTVLFKTTKGPFAVEFHRDWAPNGADRMYDLVMKKFFTDMRVFRVVDGFVAQFGISGDPTVSMNWYENNIPDDPVKQSNTEGMFTFAAGGMPNTRSTQVFVNLADNSRLDRMGFAPVGKVIFGMDAVKSLYSGYGEDITGLQKQIMSMGNRFLDEEFPKLDSIKQTAFIESIIDAHTLEEQKREAITGIKGLLPNGATAEPAPDKFKVKFACTMGDFVIECDRAWSPNGVDRFYRLVTDGYFNESKFFRVVPDFIVQFGLPADEKRHGAWVARRFPDDPFTVSNTEGTVAFAKPGQMANARAAQVFISLKDNSSVLDPQQFTPFGKVVEGLDVVKTITSKYGEQPEQSSIRKRGNDYLDSSFPGLDGINSATIVDDAAQPEPAPAAESGAAPAADPATAPAEDTTSAAAPPAEPEPAAAP